MAWKQSTSPGSTRHFSYDIAGNVLSAQDDYGHSVASSFSSATQYAAPDAIAPNANVNTIFNETDNYRYNLAGLRLWKQGTDGVTHGFYNGLDGEPLADFYLSNGSV